MVLNLNQTKTHKNKLKLGAYSSHVCIHGRGGGGVGQVLTPYAVLFIPVCVISVGWMGWVLWSRICPPLISLKGRAKEKVLIT